MKKQARAQLKDLRISPRKVRLLVDLIRSMHVDDALSELRVSKKDAARPLRKLLESVIANALGNHYLTRDSLVIEQAFVDSGRTLHRWTPRAMGRATPIRKRTSHITLILSGLLDETKKNLKKKSTEGADEDVAEIAVDSEKGKRKKQMIGEVLESETAQEKIKESKKN